MNEQQPAETTWYSTSRYYARIDTVLVAKETEKTISIIGKYGERDGRATRTDKVGFFKTWEEAHAALMTRCELKVNACRRALETANSELGNAKGMKKPEAA